MNSKKEKILLTQIKQDFTTPVDAISDYINLIIDSSDIYDDEISDEFDPDSNEAIKPDTDGVYELDGTMTIRDLNRAMDWNLPDEDANTLAGLILHEAQMIPAVGQVFWFHGFRFEVAGREANRITVVRVRPLPRET